MKHVIGIDLGGTKLSGAVFNESGESLLHKKALIQSLTGDEVANLVASFIKDLVKSAQQLDIEVKDVGICVPGISNKRNHTVWAPNIPDWNDYPLLATLTEILSDEYQITIESDRSSYVLGEKWKGALASCQDGIVIAVGTGIGAGIMASGQVIDGAHGVSGAIGWMAQYDPKSTEYRNFENISSGTGIAQITRQILEESDDSSSLRDLDPDFIKSQNVFDAFYQGDPLAINVIDRAIHHWAVAVANLVSIFNPEKIVFAGGVFGPALDFLDRIHEEAKKYAQPIAIDQVKLCGSSLNGEVGIIGSAYSALQNSGSHV